jgi:hypothetical protein
MDPTPTVATPLRGNRDPKSMSRAALAKGNPGISHNQLIKLPSHSAERIDIQRLEPVVDSQHQCKSYGYFGGRHGQNEQEHDLAVSLMPSSTGDHECQPCRIEHDFQRHQDKDQVTAYEQSGQPQREQDPR